MEKEFVPYEQSLALKELGFDEPCFKGYTEEYKTLINFHNTHTNTSVKNTLPTKPITAPLYQQVFRWFREKHKLHSFVMSDNCVKDTYAYNIGFLAEEEEELYMMEGVCKGEVKLGFTTPEKAELACLKRLIEIVKQ